MKLDGIRLNIFLCTLILTTYARPSGAGEDEMRPMKLPYTFDFDGPYYPDRSLVFDGEFPKLPHKVMVYKVKHPNISDESVRNLARKFVEIPPGGKVQREPDMGGLCLVETEDRFVHVHAATGSILFDRKFDKKGNANSKTLPSKQRCSEIAEEYLKKRDLLPKDAYLWRTLERPDPGTVRTVYKRRINGYEAIGAGAHILVTIDANGEVIHLLKQWQELVPYKLYPIKPPEQAFEELQDGKGMLFHGGEGTINKITLVYYTSPMKQNYVQPVYRFEGVGPNGWFCGEIPAIKKEYLKPRETKKGPRVKTSHRTKK